MPGRSGFLCLTDDEGEPLPVRRRLPFLYASGFTYTSALFSARIPRCNL